ncbi:MAG: hypothetical protein OEW62_10290, partial [Candidatus Bathyarchaeota archaeon]|nr:hypothetical protein [Candidatus Bathyarchaeota archaeon]
SVGAVRRAIREFYEKKGEKPSWLQDELTIEEKQTLEEEELAKILSEKLVRVLSKKIGEK